MNGLYGEELARPYKTIWFYSSKNALCNGAINRGEGPRKTDQQGKGKKQVALSLAAMPRGWPVGLVRLIIQQRVRPLLVSTR